VLISLFKGGHAPGEVPWMLANTGCFEGVIAKGISELLKVISSGVLIQDRDPCTGQRRVGAIPLSGPKESQKRGSRFCGTSRLRPRRPPECREVLVFDLEFG